jgi:hypothetical protein
MTLQPIRRKRSGGELILNTFNATELANTAEETDVWMWISWK